jgi:hypothetical protein
MKAWLGVIVLGVVLLGNALLHGCGIDVAPPMHLPLPVTSLPQAILGPVLQNATPHSMNVMWQDILPGNAILEYGTSRQFHASALRRVVVRSNRSLVYHAELKNLKPDTTYFYRIISQSSHFIPSQFRTPPAKGSNKPFRFAVYSDCQSQADVHSKIVEKGIMAQLKEELGRLKNFSNELGFVLVAGDIVQDGNAYEQYRSRFFDPIAPLSKNVPFYVAIGNHERDSDTYFDYLDLPMNGSEGYKEHWYSFDYGNSHVIALDTNNDYRIEKQLNWLDEDLDKACSDKDIDFVFAFFHHPYKSELWLKGESQYSGEIVKRLEAKLNGCGKQGAHFFGHTHGYSRGQSKDSSLYWVNVGSAGGDIDHWGEFGQMDYDVYQKSFDEFGVLMVEVNPGGNAGFKAKRLTFGDENNPKDRELQDEFSFELANNAPEKPQILDHKITSGGNQQTVKAAASEFFDGEGDKFLESEWQVVTGDGDELEVVAEKWLRFENWYEDKDTNAGLNLKQISLEFAKIEVPKFLRVRYRDHKLLWSDWSDAVSLN